VSDELAARPVAGPSWLTDRERSLLCYLAVLTVAAQMGWDEQRTADALDELAGRGDGHEEGRPDRAPVPAGPCPRLGRVRCLLLVRPPWCPRDRPPHPTLHGR